MKIASEYYKWIFDSLSEGLMMVDKNCNVAAWNKAYDDTYRDEPIKVGDNHNTKVLLTKGRTSYLRTVIDTGKPILDLDESFRMNEHTLVSIYPVKSEGSIVGGVSVFRFWKPLFRNIDQYEAHTERVKSRIADNFPAKYSFDNIVGLTQLKEHAKRLAASDANILIQGETGTGKELIAQSIHNASSRSDGAFVPVNCPAIAETLAESEIFGYEKGAFTGASASGKPGLCEIADGGTIFLDEIGDLSLSIQAKILRLLETGEFFRVGGTMPIRVSIRILAATNRNIEKMIAEGTFRQDLYYRLKQSVITIPPLRDRTGEVGMLCDIALQNALARQHQPIAASKVLSNMARKALEAYNWPGNVRELRNVMEGLSILVSRNVIAYSDLPERIRKWYEGHLQTEEEPEPPAQPGGVRQWERSFIVNYLSKNGHSLRAKKALAQELGIGLSTLYHKLKRLDIT